MRRRRRNLFSFSSERQLSMKKKNPKKIKAGSYSACLLALFLARFLALSQCASLLLIPKNTSGAHAKGSGRAFSKRRSLLQGGDSSISSSGTGDDSSASSFANLITGDDDSADRVEASPAVALAESPLSDAELCAVSKQVRRRFLFFCF